MLSPILAIVGLLRSSWGLQMTERTLLRKVIIIVTETMYVSDKSRGHAAFTDQRARRVPPATVAFVNLLLFQLKGLLSGYDRSLIWFIGPLYYYTALHSLVA